MENLLYCGEKREESIDEDEDLEIEDDETRNIWKESFLSNPAFKIETEMLLYSC